MKTSVAIFDFDGTLTTKDTVNEFVLFHFGYRRFSLFLLRNLYDFLLYLLRRIDNTKIKERIFTAYLSGMPEDVYQEQVAKFVQQRLNHIIRPEALRVMKQHLAKKHTVIVISASPQDWVQMWGQDQKVTKIYASVLQREKGKITGKMRLNCYGKEKLSILLQHHPDIQKQTLFVYTDSMSDWPLLQIADYPYYRTFPSAL